MPNSIPMSWQYILTASIRVSISFSSFAKSLMPSMYIGWLIFSCDPLSLYGLRNRSTRVRTPVALLRLLSGKYPWERYEPPYPVQAIGWIVPLLLAKLLHPAVNFNLQVFMVFSIKFMTSSDILYILRQFIIQLCRTSSYAFL